MSALRTLQSTGDAVDGPNAETIRSLGPWFHNLHLPDGTQTAPDHPLGDFPRHKWQAIAPHLPEDLQGAQVLDIGCNAGFYSFELARRGGQVTAVDSDPHYLAQAKWAARQMGLNERIDFQQRNVYEIGCWRERFDLIWFCGVFYHLRYPLLALDLVARAARGTVVFQSLHLDAPVAENLPATLGYESRERMAAPDWPAMAFIEEEFAGDPTNWWVPNSAALLALTRSAGLQLRKQVHPDTLILDASASVARDEWLSAIEQQICRAGSPTTAVAQRES